MKFDCIIMNPPYGSNRNRQSNYFHYYITIEATKYLKDETSKCISLMPISIISSRSTKKECILVKQLLSNITIQVDEFDSSVFVDTFMQEICIYECQSKSTLIKINCKKLKATVQSLENLNYGMSASEVKILQKLKNHGNIIDRYFHLYVQKRESHNASMIVDKFLKTKTKDFEYFIPISYANGSLNAKWQSSRLKRHGIITRDNLRNNMLACSTGKTFIGFKKSELKACENLLRLLDKPCLRFGLAKTQVDQNMQTKCYVYFPDIDYTYIDSEEKFYNYFGITKEEQKIIEDTLKEYV